MELRGFEPLTSSVQRRRSPGLSYSPTLLGEGGRALLGRRSPRPFARRLDAKKRLNNWIVERASP